MQSMINETDEKMTQDTKGYPRYIDIGTFFPSKVEFIPTYLM